MVQIVMFKKKKKMKKKILLEVGFEPTHPKIIELKSTALDHSATQAILI